MIGELVKREDRWDLYLEDGSKYATTAKSPFQRLSVINCDIIESVSLPLVSNTWQVEIVTEEISEEYRDGGAKVITRAKKDKDGFLILKRV